MMSGLRKHRLSLASGLLSLLLASWLTLFCGSCLAGVPAHAAAQGEAPCHEGKAPHPGCCDHTGACLNFTLPDAAAGDAWALLPQTPVWHALIVALPAVEIPVVKSARVRPLLTGPPPDPHAPAYLRFCSLLN